MNPLAALGFTDQDVLALQAFLAVRRQGKDSGLQGKLEVNPVALSSFVYWEADDSITPKNFFDKTIQSEIGDNFTGTKTFPGGFNEEYVEITHARIDPDISVVFNPAITNSTSAQAYQYFLAGTMVEWHVGTNKVFEHNIKFLLPHISVGNGASGYSLISNAELKLIKFPAPIQIPKGKQLLVKVIPPAYLAAAAAAAATNGHYPSISSSGMFGLQLTAAGISQADA